MNAPVLGSAMSIVVYGIVVPAVLLVVTIAATWVVTNIRYQISIRQNLGGKGTTRSPVKVPYALPVLGSAIGYVGSRNGSFWNWLFSWHPRSTGACTLKMGGRDLHVLYDPYAVQGIFKAREPHKEAIDVQVLNKAFGIEESEILRYYEKDPTTLEKQGGHARHPAELERINVQYFIRTDRVNELTRKFIETLRRGLASELRDGTEGMEVGLYAWMRKHLFAASVVAFFGNTLLEDYPDLEKDFSFWDQSFMTCFFQIPRWMAPEIYATRDKLTANLTRWWERQLERSKGEVVDPDGDIEWDPVQGSRAQRARINYFEEHNLKLRSRALFDFGLLFGLNSNAIPTAGWILMHIFDPRGDQTLYPRVMAEIDASKNADGTFNISTLVNQPLLQSMLHEVLRLYNDTIVMRNLPNDLTIPIGDPSLNEKLLLRRGSMVICCSWIVHRDDESWHDPPADHFYAERFLTTDSDTGRSVFSSTAGAGSRLFPWGGGKSICPGRAFAKQEILASVAMMLTEFRIETLGYLDGKGQEAKEFPGLYNGYPGPAMISPGGDLKVRITRKDVDL